MLQIMKNIQYITRAGTFDAGHRVMNERMKCFNIHGHTYLYELTFSFSSMEEIGYNIDFKEIKRVAMAWIDDYLDHGMILNPHDLDLIEICEKLNSKYWLMSLHGTATYCNPTVENIAKELFMAMHSLFLNQKGLRIYEVKLFETPNCSTICRWESISKEEHINFSAIRDMELNDYVKLKGSIEYDDRKCSI